MNANEVNNGDKYKPLIIVFTIVFIIIFIFYLVSVIIYIITNYKEKKLCVFWIDYCVLMFGSILFTSFYLINIWFAPINIEKLSLSELNKKFFPPAIVISLSFVCFTLIATLLFDAIIAVRIAIKMNKMKSIKIMDLKNLSEEFNKIDYVDILKMKSHHYYSLFFFIINIILITIEVLAYTDLDPDKFGTLFNLQGFFDYLLRFYHLIVLVFLIVSITIMNYNKNSLLKTNYYNPNRIAQKVYDAHFSQIIYFTDVLSFKLVADLIMNIPPSFFMSYGKYDVWTLLVSEISIFLYMFLGGNEYLVIDKRIKDGKVDEFISLFFCLNKLDFHFGEKDARDILEQFSFHYDEEEQNILKSLNIEILKDDGKDLSKEGSENSQSFSSIELKTKVKKK